MIYLSWSISWVTQSCAVFTVNFLTHKSEISIFDIFLYIQLACNTRFWTCWRNFTSQTVVLLAWAAGLVAKFEVCLCQDLHWKVVESYNQSQPYINIVIHNLTMKFKITLCTRKPCSQRSRSLHYRAVVMVTSYNVREWINGEFHHFIADFFDEN